MSNKYYSNPPQVVDGDIAYAKDVNDVNNEASQGFILVEADIDSLIGSVSDWTDLAEKWAQEAVDVEVAPGLYSAYHHASKAIASAAAALVSETNASASELSASNSAAAALVSAAAALLSETNAAASALSASIDADSAADSAATAADLIASGVRFDAVNSDYHVATAGQTVFTIATTVTEGNILVFHNTRKLRITEDYTTDVPTAVTQITLTSPASLGDEIEIVSLETYNISGIIDDINQAVIDTEAAQLAAEDAEDAAVAASVSAVAAKDAALVSETNANASASAAADSEYTAGTYATQTEAIYDALIAKIDTLQDRIAIDVIPSTTAILLSSANIVDVFLYNTFEDSDGGKWTYSSKSVSWYNEVLNTATRGSKREFPAIALIVAETTKVTIYDATVAGCPMWMVFNNTGSASGYLGWVSGGTVAITSVSMLNGILVVGKVSSGVAVNFITDEAKLIYNNPFQLTTNKTVAGRNVLSSYTTGGGYTIVNLAINDVAMTVLPDAPIDEDTGLTTPTIAVATNDGVSVIDGPAGVGTIVNLTSVGTICNKVFINESYLYILQQKRYYNVCPIPSVTALISAARIGYLQYIGSPVPPLLASSSNINDITDKAIASAYGLNKFSQSSPLTDSMVSYITKSYNTGWMKGDIRRAFICDAGGTTESLVGGTLTDRSVKASSLTVNGTLSRSPVATGAELQAISGSTVSNYLSQAYSADLDFGTSDFYICGWVKENPNSAIEFILSRSGYSGGYTGAGFRIYINASGMLSFLISDDAFVTSDLIVSSSAIDDSTWKFCTLVKRGSLLELWINGSKGATDVTIVNTLASLSNGTATLYIGLSQALTSPLTNGTLALWRMGVGAPSQEQIEKMYQDELALFQEDAKCTLQGTSDSVQALAYNDRYDKLLVGTADGVTVFDKLVVDGDFFSDTGSIKSLSSNHTMNLSGTSTDAYYEKP